MGKESCQDGNGLRVGGWDGGQNMGFWDILSYDFLFPNLSHWELVMFDERSIISAAFAVGVLGLGWVLNLEEC